MTRFRLVLGAVAFLASLVMGVVLTAPPSGAIEVRPSVSYDVDAEVGCTASGGTVQCVIRID
jgi:hypothetical protein